MKTDDKRGNKRAAALRGGAREGESEQLERERRYMDWKHLTRNQKEVARRLAHGEEKLFLTSLDVHTPRDVVERHDLRSPIENCGNRDLKSRQTRDST